MTPIFGNNYMWGDLLNRGCLKAPWKSVEIISHKHELIFHGSSPTRGEYFHQSRMDRATNTVLLTDLLPDKNQWKTTCVCQKSIVGYSIGLLYGEKVEEDALVQYVRNKMRRTVADLRKYQWDRFKAACFLICEQKWPARAAPTNYIYKCSIRIMNAKENKKQRIQ